MRLSPVIGVSVLVFLIGTIAWIVTNYNFLGRMYLSGRLFFLYDAALCYGVYVLGLFDYGDANNQ